MIFNEKGASKMFARRRKSEEGSAGDNPSNNGEGNASSDLPPCFAKGGLHHPQSPAILSLQHTGSGVLFFSEGTNSASVNLQLSLFCSKLRPGKSDPNLW